MNRLIQFFSKYPIIKLIPLLKILIKEEFYEEVYSNFLQYDLNKMDIEITYHPLDEEESEWIFNFNLYNKNSDIIIDCYPIRHSIIEKLIRQEKIKNILNE